jgi:hypothetical protein
MPSLIRPLVIQVRSHASCGPVAFLTLACFALATSGCLSNEYAIQKDELLRVAAIAPDARGQSVRVSQKLGERRADAVEEAIPAGDQGGESYESSYSPSGDVSLNVNVEGGGSSSGGGSHGGPLVGGGFRGTTPSGSFHGAPPGGGFHGASAGGAFHGTPVPKGGGGGSLNLGGGGGGKGGEVLLVLVVVAIVGATIATVALAASEGMRFEGHAEMSPEQVIYLSDAAGTHAVPLRELTTAQAAAADSALVMDDEGYGLRRLDHAPLDRRGGVFRFDLGAGAFNLGATRASGFSAHIQAGAYVTHTLGLVFDFGIGTGTADPCCAPLPVPTDTMTRLSFGLEAQALPLAWGPLHLGAFAGGGFASAGAAGVYESGPLASAGALLELDLTSHMALAVRGGASEAWLPSGMSTAGTITGGLAIY